MDTIATSLKIDFIVHTSFTHICLVVMALDEIDSQSPSEYVYISDISSRLNVLTLEFYSSTGTLKERRYICQE